MSSEREQAFYREVPVDDGGLAFRRLFATNLRLRCPACGRGNVARGFFGVKERCEECGSRFNRLEGNELISMSLSFFFASLLTAAIAFPLILAFGFFPGVTWLLVGVAVATAVLFLRPMRVLTLWLLWMLGFVYPDHVAKPGVARRRDG